MTERLKKIVSAIPFSEELFDVGCDHGIVGVNALLQKKSAKSRVYRREPSQS